MATLAPRAEPSASPLNISPDRTLPDALLRLYLAPMTDYVAAICYMVDGALTPVESLNLTADTANEAIKKAVAWRIEMINSIDPDQKAWLQVLCDGVSIYSKEIGRRF